MLQRRRVAMVAIVGVLVGVLAASPPSVQVAQAAGTAPVHLTVDGRPRPDGLDPSRVDFSWWLSDTTRGARQTSYSIEVSAEGALGTPIWASGRVVSAVSTNVAYGGSAPLAMATTYSWRVRTWNAIGVASDWSAWAQFETGLADWSGANWLAVKGLVRGQTTVTPSPVTWARLYVATRGDKRYNTSTDFWAFDRARGIYVATLNGAPVTDAVLEGERDGDTTKRIPFQTYDVTPLVRPGENAIGFEFAELSDLRAVLVVRHADGSEQRWTSTPAMRTHAGAVSYARRFFGERFDARSVVAGWDLPDFDAAAWQLADLSGVYQVAAADFLSRNAAVSCSDQSAPGRCDLSTQAYGWTNSSLVDGDVTSAVNGGGLGFHSRFQTSVDIATWVQLDLGESVDIGSITAWPVNGNAALDYGFPRRYRVEVSDDATFSMGVTTVADRTDADQPLPLGQPQSFAFAGRARYVRFTATKLAPTKALNLAELTVAQLAPESSSGCCDPSPWLQVDLGRDRPVGQVVMYPSPADADGSGWPARARVDVCADVACTAPATVWSSPQDMATPDAPLVIDIGSPSSRYVRVTATTPATTPTGEPRFTLAELAVAPPEPAVAMVGRSIEPMRLGAPIRAASLTQPVPGVWLYDFGRNIAGTTQLNVVVAAANRQINIRHSEVLSPAGRATTGNIWAAQYDTYVTRGDGGGESWKPRFTYAGFRYAELTNFPGTPTADSLVAFEEHNDVASTGTFTSSNGLVDNISAAVRQTVLANLHNVPEDCPTREKRGWLADASLVQAAASNNFDMTSVYREFFRHMTDAQLVDGRVPDYVPVEPRSVNPSDLAWGVATVMMPWDLYQRTGDLGILDEQYDTMSRWLAYEQRTFGTNLVFSGADWQTERTEGRLWRTALYFHAADLMRQVAGLLARPADATAFATLAGQIRTRLNAAFLQGSGTAGARYQDAANTPTSAQLANALPLLVGAVPTADVAAVRRALVDAVQASGGLPVPDNDSRSLVNTTRYVVAALQEMGRSDLVYSLIATRTGDPSYAWMLDRGPGTIWELWNADDQTSSGSRNHPALGSIGSWFYEGLAGIRPDPAGPGYKRSLLVPSMPVGLDTAAASITTPYGMLSSGWRRTPSGYRWEITVPANTTSTVSLPRLGGAVTVVESGVAVYADGAAAATVAGLQYLGTDADAVRFTAAAGSYSFDVLLPQQGNLALGRPVTVRAATGFAEWQPRKATDGVRVSTPTSGGYHSPYTNTNPNQAEWMTIDLGSSQPIGQVVLFPAHPAGYPGGFGFPVRYRIETSNDNAVFTTFTDRTNADQANPGDTPQAFDGNATARYVRVSATQLRAIYGSSYSLVMAEVEVYAVPSNLALRRTVTARSSIGSPTWFAKNATDGVRVSNATIGGYHSTNRNTDPNQPEWVTVDLGSVRPIGQVVLFPARPPGYPAGFGFPVRYAIETSNDGVTWSTFADRASADQPSPGDAPVALDGSASARFVRVSATKLRLLYGTTYSLVLAEIEVHAPPGSAPPFTGAPN